MRPSELLTELHDIIASAPAGELPSIRGELARLEAELMMRLTTPQAPEVPSDDTGADQCIGVDAVAAILGETSRWVRDHKELHQQLGRVEMGGRRLRFWEKRVRAFIKRRSYG